MTYYKIIAENARTKQRVQEQALNGYEYSSEKEAWEAARSLADKMTTQSGEPWVAKVDTYSK